MKKVIILLLCFTFIGVYAQHTKKVQRYKTIRKDLVVKKDSTVLQISSKDTIFQIGENLKPGYDVAIGFNRQINKMETISVWHDTMTVFKFSHTKPKGIK